jgi:hypothetical protein
MLLQKPQKRAKRQKGMGFYGRSFKEENRHPGKPFRLDFKALRGEQEGVVRISGSFWGMDRLGRKPAVPESFTVPVPSWLAPPPLALRLREEE